MKKTFLVLSSALLLVACGRTDTSETNTVQSVTAVAPPDSVALATPKNCQSLVDGAKLGKADVYEESAKNLKVSLTLAQAESTLSVADNCYYNNSVEVLATKRSGSQVFKHRLQKDDLTAFTKDDEPVEQGILQKVTYLPTFNSQKYITLTLQLIDPATKKTRDYTVYMNYYGEIVKVK